MYVKGVGMTKFGILDQRSHISGYQAMMEALQDAQMSINDIDAVFVGSLEWFMGFERQRHIATMMASIIKRDIPIVRVPSACGTGGACIWSALRSGYDNVLVVGMEKLNVKSSQAITDDFLMGGDRIWEQTEGLIFPAQNALVASEYMQRYDATIDDLALIAYKNHKNAFLNPKAYFYKKAVTLEQIKKSPIVASPFRLFDCSVSVDGGAAVVLSKDKSDVEIKGSSYCVDYLTTFEKEDVATWDATVIAAKEAYKQAGISAPDIDVAEVHDAFTIVELLAYEDLGFAKKGEGAKLIRDGTVELNGKLPVNTSGGLKAKGHPVSVTGIAQAVEIVQQLRGNCGERQVDNAKIGLTQNIGGSGGNVSVHIFKKVNG